MMIFYAFYLSLVILDDFEGGGGGWEDGFWALQAGFDVGGHPDALDV